MLRQLGMEKQGTVGHTRISVRDVLTLEDGLQATDTFRMLSELPRHSLKLLLSVSNVRFTHFGLALQLCQCSGSSSSIGF